MKTSLSPLDIQKRRFGQKLRGYDPEDVDAFLALVAEEFERVLRECAELERQRGLMREELDDLSARENILKDTMLSAQRVSEELRENARKEAQLLVKEAELAGERIVDEASRRASSVETAVRDLRLQRRDLRARVRTLLDGLTTMIAIDEEEEQGGEVLTMQRRPPSGGGRE